MGGLDSDATGTLQVAGVGERRFSLDMEYDGLGRITRMNQVDEVLPSGGGAPVTVTATTRDNSYSYSSPRVHAATVVGTNQYLYDSNGNQYFKQDTVSGDWRYLTWDEEDRLLYAFRPNSTTGFQYDAGGIRTHKTDYKDTTLYPSAYVTIRNGAEVTKHIWAAGERVSSVVRSTPGDPSTDRAYWMHNDHLGGGHYVTTKVGAVYEQAERLPFGESWVQERAGSDRVSASFAGSAYDEESDLHYHGARYYDAREARWASRDPAIEDNMASGGVLDPRNLGLYTYAFNSPVSYWDPDGRQTSPAGGGAQPSAGAGPQPVTQVCPHNGQGCETTSVYIPARPVTPAQGTPASSPESGLSQSVRTGINAWRTYAGGAVLDALPRLPNINDAGWRDLPTFLMRVHPLVQMVEANVSLPGAIYTSVTGRNVGTGQEAGGVERGLATVQVVGTAVGVGAEVPALRAAAQRAAPAVRAFLASEEGAVADVFSILRMFAGEARGQGGGIRIVNELAAATEGTDATLARYFRTDARFLTNLADAWRSQAPTNLREFIALTERVLRETIHRSATVFTDPGPSGATMAVYGGQSGIGVAVVNGSPVVWQLVGSSAVILGRLL